MRKTDCLLASLATLATLACGSGETAAPVRKSLSAERAPAAAGPNQPPVVSQLALSTRDPVPGVPIEARFEGADPNGDALSFEVHWLRNGESAQKGDSRSWTPGALAKGDRIELRVRASDGQVWSEAASASARVGNRAPEIENILFEPADEPKRGEPLVATPIASDADGDEVEFEYEWRVNGEALRGSNDPRFISMDVKRGDRVRVRVIARDGEDESAPAESLELTIANSAPVIEKFGGFEAVGGEFRHQFRATDPDGDGGLRFHLGQGPRGMELDPILGLATWRPDAEASGKIPVQIEVRDSYGAASALRFELTLNRGEAAAPAAPAAQSDEE